MEFANFKQILTANSYGMRVSYDLYRPSPSKLEAQTTDVYYKLSGTLKQWKMLREGNKRLKVLSKELELRTAEIQKLH